MTGTRTPTASVSIPFALSAFCPPYPAHVAHPRVLLTCCSRSQRDRDATPSPSTHTPRPSTPNNNSSSLPVLDTLNLSHYGDSSLQFDDPSTQSTPHQSPRYERSFLYSPPPPPVPEVNPGHFPPEIISLITQHLYYLILPPPERPEGFPSPDPYLHLLPREAVYLPPRFAPSLPEQAREAFRNLALVDKTWGEEATRALWRKLSFGMPRAWESVLRMVEEYKQGRRIKRAEREDVGGSGWSIGTIGGSGIERRQSSGAGELLRERVFDWGEDSKWQAMAGVGTPDGRMLENGELEVSTPTGASFVSLELSDAPRGSQPKQLFPRHLIALARQPRRLSTHYRSPTCQL